MFLNWPHVLQTFADNTKKSFGNKKSNFDIHIRLSSLFIKHVVVLYLQIASFFVLVVVALDFVRWLGW